MAPFLDRPIGRADPAKVAEAADAIVRFGNWISSLKGRPIDPAVVFQGAAPSSIARRRLPKLVGAIERMITHLTPHAEGDAVPGAAAWLAELQSVHAIAVRERDAQRAGRADEVKLAPDAAAARADWLATYAANKHVIEGILRHERKEHLMTLIFDDLAEVQRARPQPGEGPTDPAT